MTQTEFRDAVVEQVYVRGYDCPKLTRLADYILVNWSDIVASPDPSAFAERCRSFPGVIHQAERLGKRASPTVAPCGRWIAVHEAGHAIVGMKSGLALRGIRFYGEDGFPGETGFEFFDWASSSDEQALRWRIRVDVAANLAEIILNVREPDGGYPSRFFDTRDMNVDGEYPSDIVEAWKCALRLAEVMFRASGRPLDLHAMKPERRAIVEQGEAEADQILRGNLDALNRLADALQAGAMTGAAVRAIVEK